MNNGGSILGIAVLILAIASGITKAEEIRIKENARIIKQDANEIYNQGLIENVCFSLTEKAISLVDRVLIENDSPGAGLNRLGASSEKITSEIWARKEFFIEDSRAFQAWILFMAHQDKENRVPLSIDVNGHTMVCSPEGFKTKRWSFKKFSEEKNSISGYLVRGFGFFYMPFSSSWLKKGENEVILKVKDWPSGWHLGLADYRNFHKGMEKKMEKFPYTSFRSSNGGKTWSKRLGSKKDIEREYTIRLYLRRYCPQGNITSPIIDLAEPLEEPHFIKERAGILEATLNWEKKIPSETSVIFYVRSGKTPFYERSFWGEWQRYDERRKFSPAGRYLQWKALLTTKHPLRTPLITSAEIRVKISNFKPAFADKVWVGEYQNEKILRSAFPYEYESYDHPKLKELRKKFELDSVVAGTKTEFEKIVRLMHWAYTVPLAPRWSKTTDYSWNALDYCMLKRTEEDKIR